MHDVLPQDGLRRPAPGPLPPPSATRSGLRPATWALALLVPTLALGGAALARSGGDEPTPGADPSHASSHAFLDVDPVTGAPIGYDPCQLVIPYVVRPDGAPAGTEGVVAEAADEVGRATGFVFRDDGGTDHGPVYEPYATDLVGTRTVVVTWSTDAESADLEGDVAGWAISHVRPALPGRAAYRADGVIALDAAWAATVIDQPGGRAAVRRVVLHELGHVLGLDHVDDPTQVMHPGSPARALGSGDLAGLAALGTSRCTG